MHLRVVLASVLAPVLVVGVALVGGFWASGRAADSRSSLTAALDTLPADTQVAGFTDWSLIRRHLDLGSASTRAARAALNDDASLRDLTTRSVIGRSIEEMHSSFGWSAADVDWEAYGQAADGAAMVAHLDRSVSLATVRAGLRKLGYVDDGRIWSIAGSTDATVSDDLIGVLGAVAIVPRERLIVAAGRSTYVSTVLQVIDRKQPSLLSVRRAADVAAPLVGTDSALLQRGVVACDATSLKDTSADVKAQGQTAAARAGGLENVDFAGRGLVDESATRQSLRFAMSFASPAQAAQQLRVRAQLVTGPFIGREGRLEDSLTLTDSTTEGSTATLRFDHPSGSVAYMTAEGPLLFAGCPA
ncbi:MAG: hypothetical protein JWR83_2550 [Aeromicrobium sp.]|nr:hypothetical protein [Aeromicrobium sp.]